MRRVSLLLLIAILLAPGCGRETVTSPPPSPDIRSRSRDWGGGMPVDAVIAPDSVATGDSMTVRLYVEYGGCETFGGIEVERRGNSIVLTPYYGSGKPGDAGACPAIWHSEERSCRIACPQAGDLILVAPGFILPVHVGARPASAKRYSFRVLDLVTRLPLPGLEVRIFSGGPLTPPWAVGSDTLASLVTDRQGRVEVALGCEGVDPGYWVEMKRGLYSSYYRWSAPACGEPQRGVFHSFKRTD